MGLMFRYWDCDRCGYNFISCIICAATMDSDGFPTNMLTETYMSPWVIRNHTLRIYGFGADTMEHIYSKHFVSDNLSRVRFATYVGSPGSGVQINMEHIIEMMPQLILLKFDINKALQSMADIYKKMHGEPLNDDWVTRNITKTIQLIEPFADGFEYFIAAMAELDYECAICGAGYDSSPPSYEICIEHARKCVPLV